MPLLPREVAEAISTHDFEAAFAQLSEAIVWHMPGAATLEGRAAVEDACRETAASLVSAEIRRQRVEIIDAGDKVVVETLTVYRDTTGSTTVASCDVYEFDADFVITITSYNVAV